LDRKVKAGQRDQQHRQQLPLSRARICALRDFRKKFIGQASKQEKGAGGKPPCLSASAHPRRCLPRIGVPERFLRNPTAGQENVMRHFVVTKRQIYLR
jgi:hypothetical protein